MIDLQKNVFQLVSEGITKNQHFICADKIPEGWQHHDPKYFLQTVQDVTLSLYALGLRKGDKIILHADNSCMWLIMDLAIMALGAICVPIYATQSKEQTAYILQHSEAKALCIDHDKIASFYQDIVLPYPDLIKIRFDDKESEGFYNFEQFKAQGQALKEKDLFERLYTQITPDDLCMISYTSGTTGTPKGVMLSHRNMVHAIQSPIKRCFFYKEQFDPKDTVLSFLPFTHIFEHCVIYAYLTVGIPVYIVAKPEMIKEVLVEKKPIHFTTVPRILEKIYQNIMQRTESQSGFSGALARFALSRTMKYQLNASHSLIHYFCDFFVYRKIRAFLGGALKGITSGGAALSPDIMRFFNAVGIAVSQGYGLTETAPGLTVYNKEQLILGSAGQTLEDVTIKIAEDGEILAKGPNIMQGYFKDPENTHKVLKDGWFHTGDIGHIDENGNLFITDRKKELLKLSTGKYIAPAPIENKLILYPVIEQAMVIGDGQKYCSVLIITSKERLQKCQNTIEDILKKVNKTLSPWERIKKYHISTELMTIENGELTATLKKRRHIIRQNRQKEIHILYDQPPPF